MLSETNNSLAEANTARGPPMHHTDSPHSANGVMVVGAWTIDLIIENLSFKRCRSAWRMMQDLLVLLGRCICGADWRWCPRGPGRGPSVYALNVVLVFCPVRKDGVRGTCGSGKGEGVPGRVAWCDKSDGATECSCSAPGRNYRSWWVHPVLDSAMDVFLKGFPVVTSLPCVLWIF